MALTLDVEQKLEKCGLIDFFTAKKTNLWKPLAQRTYNFVKGDFPTDSKIRPDDVCKQLQPMLEIHEELIDYFSVNKLTQKYWFRHFADLILDRTWAEIISQQPRTGA